MTHHPAAFSETPIRIARRVAAVAMLVPPGAGAEERPIEFMRHVKPLLEAACVECHGPEKEEGGYRMDTREAAFLGGSNYPEEAIVPGEPDISAVYWMTTETPGSDDLMPPDHPLGESQQQIIRDWIENGAHWPDGVVLARQRRVTSLEASPLLERGGPFSREEAETLRLWAKQGADWKSRGELLLLIGDGLELVELIRAKILGTRGAEPEDAMADYEAEIPQTGVPYEMVAIPGGEFLMGSPPDEAHRLEDEGPQRRVEVAPFWMGKFEVTWDQFEPFMVTAVPRDRDGAPRELEPDAPLPAIVSSPTNPYTEMDFGMGKGRHPAICMTQHAASKFCQWLSAQTGRFYRLPTEAEWEYACRAGTTTARYFGDDPADLDEYEWYWSEGGLDKYQEVGLKKPNPWGLHDMLGNVMEWCLDQYFPDAYATGRATRPADWLHPRVIRGGSWYDDAEKLRSSARTASDPAWNSQDVDLPRSIWYLTDAHWLGFRLVRPLEVPSAEEMHWYWNSASGLNSSKPSR